MCAHREAAYAVQPWRSSGSLSHSEEAQDRSVLLPLFPQLKQAEQEHIVSSLRKAVSYEAVVSAHH
jgi:dTDP-4-amino-4,6-dideoxygalactose transaminase